MGDEEGYGERRICQACARKKQPVLQNTKSVSAGCEDCEKGDLGTTKCYVCFANIHNNKKCSVKEKNSSNKLVRLCMTCKKKNILPAIEASREIENWKGQAKKNEALYLGGKKEMIKDGITLNRHTKLPVLRNANHHSMHPIKLDKEQIYITNTCAFDSISQVLFVAVTDNVVLRKEVNI